MRHPHAEIADYGGCPERRRSTAVFWRCFVRLAGFPGLNAFVGEFSSLAELPGVGVAGMVSSVWPWAPLYPLGSTTGSAGELSPTEGNNVSS